MSTFLNLRRPVVVVLQQSDVVVPPPSLTAHIQVWPGKKIKHTLCRYWNPKYMHRDRACVIPMQPSYLRHYHSRKLCFPIHWDRLVCCSKSWVYARACHTNATFILDDIIIAVSCASQYSGIGWLVSPQDIDLSAYRPICRKKPQIYAFITIK